MSDVTVVLLNDSSNKSIVGVQAYDRPNGGVLVIPADTAFPGTAVAGELFYNQTTGILYRRDDANTAWVALTTGTASVPTSRQVIAGDGLVGGGDLSADRTFDVVAGDGSIVVNANDIVVGVINGTQHGNQGGGGLHASATPSAAGFLSASDKTKLDGLPTNAVPDTRLITAGISLVGGGDLSADRVVDLEVETFEASESAGGTVLGAAPTLMPFDTVDQNNAGGNYNYADPNLTIAAAGLYEIGFSLLVDKATGTGRQTSAAAVFVDGSPVLRSAAYGYHRNTSNGEGTLVNNVRVTLTPSAVVTVRAQVVSGAGTLIQVGSGQSKFYAKRIG